MSFNLQERLTNIGIDWAATRTLCLISDYGVIVLHSWIFHKHYILYICTKWAFPYYLSITSEIELFLNLLLMEKDKIVWSNYLLPQELLLKSICIYFLSLWKWNFLIFGEGIWVSHILGVRSTSEDWYSDFFFPAVDLIMKMLNLKWMFIMQKVLSSCLDGID